MKLLVSRSQSLETKRFSSLKTKVYSIKIVAELTEEEERLLEGFEYLRKTFPIDPEITANLEVKKEATGPGQISINDLKRGMEWTCGYLPIYFTDIPGAILSRVKGMLGAAIARERWGGEEVIEVALDVVDTQ
ncbi:MAG: hypothetical protein HY794_09705 [Desulfarculus sp.]|nr:hypothetical protein [Desulfarculus sp.]